MRQLRLVGLAEDGDSLLLETPTGEAFRLPLDDRVRAASRGDLTRLGQIEIEMDNPLRPREIQMRVRAGESAEQIAASSGMPLDRVLRFAYAVLQERGRVVSQARGTAARPKATDTLGDLVEGRLIGRGTDASTLEWDAWRREDGRWAVRLSWRHGEHAHAAHWSLDLARRVLLPEDPAAEQLTAAEYHARTITAVTPLAVAARAADPARPTDLHREAGPTRPGPPRAPDPTRPGPSRVTEPTRPGPSRVTEPNRTGPGPAAEPQEVREQRRTAERRPGEPSRRAHRSEPAAEHRDAPAEATEQHPAGPSIEEIRAGGRRPGSDHRSHSDEDHRGRTVAERPDPAGEARDGHRTGQARDGRRAETGGRLRDAHAASERRADPAGQMRDARPGRREPAGRGGGGPEDGGEEPPAEELRQVAGGGTIPLVDVESEEDRARRATVPSWDDILLGVRRRH